MHEKRKDTGVKQQIVREKKGEYSIDKAAQPQKDMMLKKKHQKRIVRANLNPGNQTKTNPVSENHFKRKANQQVRKILSGEVETEVLPRRKALSTNRKKLPKRMNHRPKLKVRCEKK